MNDRIKHIFLFFRLKVPQNRIFGLDILRCFAIITVVILHSAYLLPEPYKQIIREYYIDGVTVFFVLSGYLIGRILINQILDGKTNFSNLLWFWVRRWLRTLPNYYLILVIICLSLYFSNSSFSLKRMVPFFLHFQNFYYVHSDLPWLSIIDIPVFGESWSLSVEEWFYIIAPIALIFSSKIIKPKKAILLTILIFILFSTLIRVYRHSVLIRPDWNFIFRVTVVSRMDSLMYGVLGAYLHLFFPNLWMNTKKKLFVLGIIALIASRYYYLQWNTLYNDILYFTVDSISVLCLLPFLSTLKKGKGKIYGLITRISLISYSMYLVNLTLIQGVIFNSFYWCPTQLFRLQWSVKFLSYWILTFVFSIILYKYFELPIMKYRDKIKRYKQPPYDKVC